MQNLLFLTLYSFPLIMTVFFIVFFPFSVINIHSAFTMACDMLSFDRLHYMARFAVFCRAMLKREKGNITI